MKAMTMTWLRPLTVNRSSCVLSMIFGFPVRLENSRSLTVNIFRFAGTVNGMTKQPTTRLNCKRHTRGPCNEVSFFSSSRYMKLKTLSASSIIKSLYRIKNMSNFVIKGGKKLTGEITTNTAKNAALSCMYACLLTDEESCLDDMPRIEEVERTREVFESIGVKTQWISEHTLAIAPPKKIQISKINAHAAEKTRVSLFLIGALIHKYKKFDIPRSGGCKLGNRTIFPPTFALEKFGANVTTTPKYYHVECKGKITAAEVVMYEAGDTPTENAILAAVLAHGTTTIKFCSANYMVQDLCYLLNSMGAHITGIGTTTLTIKGAKKLRGADHYPIIPDPIESMLLLSLAATTNSSILIKNCPKDFLELELTKLKVMNFRFEITKKYRSKNKHFELIDIRTSPSNLKAIESPDKIEARPYPGLNIDNLPYFVPI